MRNCPTLSNMGKGRVKRLWMVVITIDLKSYNLYEDKNTYLTFS